MKRPLWLSLPFVTVALLTPNSVLAGFDEAMSFLRKQDYVSAMAELHPLAEKGDSRAQVELGRMFARGRGTSPDDVEAVRWYRKAAEANDPIGQYLLGYMYAKGRGVDLDNSTAVFWYRRAAEQDHEEAQYGLAMMLESGLGAPKDAAQAANWYRKAADRDHGRAQYALGRLLASGTGVNKNLDEAMSWYRKAADNDYSLAANELGVLYWNGKEIARDDVVAVEWFRRGAELDNSYAQANLAFAYLRGRGIAQDNAAANKWFMRAAENGSATAELELGVSYARGRGVAVDYAQAADWYRKAAEKGNAQAQANLAFCLREGRGVARDDAAAIEWYRKAQALGNTAGMLGLGFMYQHERVSGGRGMADAIPWFRKAAERGDADAQAKVGVAFAWGLGVTPDNTEAKKWLRLAEKGGNKQAGAFLRAMYGSESGDASANSADNPTALLGMVPGSPSHEAFVEVMREQLKDPVTFSSIQKLGAKWNDRGPSTDDLSDGFTAYYSDQDLQTLVRLFATRMAAVDRAVCVAFAHGDDNAIAAAFLQNSTREEITQYVTLIFRALFRWSSNERREATPTPEQVEASTGALLAALPDGRRDLVLNFLNEPKLVSDDNTCEAVKILFRALADLPGPAGKTLRRSLLNLQMRDMPAIFDGLQG
jgi:TPR repeat protein